VEGKNASESGFCPARFGSGECRSVRLVVLVSGRVGLDRPAWSRAVPGAQRLRGRVRETTGGAGSELVPPRPNIAIAASPPEQSHITAH